MKKINHLKKLSNFFKINNFKKEASYVLKMAEDQAFEKPSLYFLIGYPASGKTDWIKRNGMQSSTVSRDDIVASKAKELKIGRGTYDDMFTRLSNNIDLPKIPEKEAWEDEGRDSEINEYIDKIVATADEYNSNPKNSENIEMYGKLAPYTKDMLKKIILNFKVPPSVISPFSYEKVLNANNEVERDFSAKISSLAKSGKDIVIDMMSLNKGSRDGQRKKIIAAIEGISEGAANPYDINKYYNQFAIVFAPESGYSEDIIEQIKKVNKMREQEEIAAGRKKTIPDSVYKTKYEAPTPDEGFTKVEFAGVPSLNKLKGIEND